MAKKNSQTNQLAFLNHKILIWLLILVAVFVLVFFILATTVYAMRLKYNDKIWPNVSLANVEVGRLTADKALQEVRVKINKFSAEGVNFVSPEKTITIYPTTIAPNDPDISSELIHWDVNQSIKQAEQIGHGNLLADIANLSVLVREKKLPLKYTWNRQEIKSVLESSYEGILSPKKEAQLYFENDRPLISSQATGIAFSFDQSLDQMSLQLGLLNNQGIELKKIIEQPQLTKEELTPLLPQIDKALNFQQFNITYPEGYFVITPEVMKKWLTFERQSNGKIILAISQSALNDWLAEPRKSIETEVKDAKFQLTNGRVSEFQASSQGRKISDQILLERLNQNLMINQDTELPLETVEPQTSVADVNDLGIKEILGTGVSDFSGSPVNRRFNIKVGADSLNGIIVKPGEEFSLLKALGEINGETGYRTELVIKGDKTVPEYGGGLCQIGTTTFRATLASGLPVTQRRNHSYRVVYYEPAGTDATIYDPAPDYRFKNDTEHNILIQTRIDGDKLYFDFWGTKDGRQVEQTDPVIYNIVRPAATKYVETTDLPVGKMKCTESSHNGADAKFDYTITYPDGTVDATTFNSHYVPWQAVCLVGVEQLTPPTDGATATSTGEVLLNSLN